MDSPSPLLSTGGAAHTLRRYPLRKQEPLRAWDAADELILHHLADKPIASTLIVNDGFGALALGTLTGAPANQPPISQGDSFIGQLSTRQNLIANGLPENAVHLLSSLETPSMCPQRLVIKIPKTLALLEHQLLSLRPLLNPDTEIIAGAMVKSIQRSTLDLFERCIGPTNTSLAKKKARLVFAQLDPGLNPGPSPYPTRYRWEHGEQPLINHANLFSRERLDIGTRLLLEHLPRDPDYDQIMDLACGNGVVGLLAAKYHPSATLHFRDESFMAVASAKSNFRQLFGNERAATFQAEDCLSGIPSASLDLILNNPPFHQQNAVGDHIARRMFRQSRQCLRPGGELWVIGNRHLGYHVQLKKLFGNCKVVASNAKFVVLKATRQA